MQVLQFMSHCKEYQASRAKATPSFQTSTTFCELSLLEQGSEHWLAADGFATLHVSTNEVFVQLIS